MIEVKGLTKYYGERAAIHDLNFSIDRGEVIGFLGLNGAGKTTTLKVLGCVLLPTAGEVHVLAMTYAANRIALSTGSSRGVGRSRRIDIAITRTPHSPITQ